MTAGRGVAHSEEGTGRGNGRVHGVQLWVAQPDATRDGAPAFEHHADLPVVDVGPGTATVLNGAIGASSSPARRDTDHVGMDLVLGRGTARVPVQSDHEHALVVFEGAVLVDGVAVTPGHLAYLGVGRDELAVVAEGPARALLIGGVPMDDEVVMWWNYVARTRDEIIDAHEQWTARDERFGRVASALQPIDVAPPRWRRGEGASA
jgi:redox-sensitive bicupin YhaK (pirin superfamily)